MLQKIRIHELAKDLMLNSKDIIGILGDFDIQVKNHMTILEENQLDIIFEVLTRKFDKGGEFKIPNKNRDNKIVEEKKEEIKPVQKEEAPAKPRAEKPKKERVAVVVNTRSEAVDVNRIEKVIECFASFSFWWTDNCGLHVSQQSSCCESPRRRRGTIWSRPTASSPQSPSGPSAPRSPASASPARRLQ